MMNKYFEVVVFVFIVLGLIGVSLGAHSLGESLGYHKGYVKGCQALAHDMLDDKGYTIYEDKLIARCEELRNTPKASK